MSEEPKFRCSYELDSRLDHDLVALNQEIYRFLQSSIEGVHQLKSDADGMPDGVQYYLLYASALVYGAADAVLTLALHNLGREARLLERQMFECWVRAAYYADHPAEARIALHATPFSERAILDELGYERDSERYRAVVAACEEVELRQPESRGYREPRITSIIDPGKNPELMRFYALHYRVTSQMAHATFAGSGNIWSEDGVSFDSREALPNFAIESSTVYLLAFLELVDKHLELGVSRAVDEFKRRWNEIFNRLAA